MDKNGKKISEVRGMIDRKNAQQMAEALVDKMTVDELIDQFQPGWMENTNQQISGN